MAGIDHLGKVSFWSGKGRALCGATIPKAEYKDGPLGGKKAKKLCPRCVALDKAGKR